MKVTIDLPDNLTGATIEIEDYRSTPSMDLRISLPSQVTTATIHVHDNRSREKRPNCVVWIDAWTNGDHHPKVFANGIGPDPQAAIDIAVAGIVEHLKNSK